MHNAGAEIVTIITAIIGVALLAVLVGTNSKTSSVISASTSGLGYLLSVAESPVTGSTPTAPMSSSF